MENLKKSNRYQIFAFLLLNAFIFWCVLKGFYEFNDVQKWSETLKSFATIGAVIAPLVTIFANGLVSSHWKAVLVYWRCTNPLPGSFAFTDAINKDPRIDIPNLIIRIGELPIEPSQQNALWYKLYQKHQNVVQVHESHRSWLLLRDITSISFLIFIILGLSALFSMSPVWLKLFYLGYLYLSYMVLSYVAAIYGNRFVANVLVIESHSMDVN